MSVVTLRGILILLRKRAVASTALGIEPIQFAPVFQSPAVSLAHSGSPNRMPFIWNSAIWSEFPLPTLLGKTTLYERYGVLLVTGIKPLPVRRVVGRLSVPLLISDQFSPPLPSELSALAIGSLVP